MSKAKPNEIAAYHHAIQRFELRATLEPFYRSISCAAPLVTLGTRKQAMARTESTMLPLGTAAPDFHLTDVVSGEQFSLESFRDRKALLVMFICRHCPYVKHVQNEIARIGKDYAGRSLGIAAISSNDADAYPDDAPESLREMAAELQFEFPYLYDDTQDVARAYAAACTPDFFLFDRDRKLFYRGQLDRSRRGNSIPVTGSDLRDAIDAVLDNRPAPSVQYPSLGCNIKWRVR